MSNTTYREDAVDLVKRQERPPVVEKDLGALRYRNHRVESNKAWETSRVRLLSITTILYVTIVLVFLVLDPHGPLMDALVPAAGFCLSTLSLSFLRQRLEKRASPR